MRMQTEETRREIKIVHRQDETIRQMDSLPRKLFQGSSKTGKTRNRKRPEGNPQLEKKKEKRDQPLQLNDIISKKKVGTMKQNFIEKIRFNSIHRTPSTMELQQNLEQKGKFFNSLLLKLEKKQGINVQSCTMALWNFINILQISIMVFIFSIMMVFDETKQKQEFLYLRIGSISLYIIDMILNFTTKRFQSGKDLNNLREIGESYIKQGFFIDLISIMIFSVEIFIHANIAVVETIIALIKLRNSIKKIQKYEYLYIGSSDHEHYYGLIKVLITNFIIGHVLSILLNLMAGIEPHKNWYMKINISSKDPWFVKYIWGYYWGTNIMLTVGFGDLAANNHYEAIILVFIETFSCITLAYNVSYVGALISSLRESEIQKRKKLKFFHRMCKQNEIPNQLEKKITNHIEESYSIKDSFAYDQYDEVLQSLPENMQIQYRKEANKTLFDGLGFLNNLTKKSLLRMAQLVERRICHPDETVLKKGSKSQFMILQKGTLCFSCRLNRNKLKLQGKVIQTLKVEENEKPKLISLDFIKNKAVNYDIKSKQYSILYVLPEEKFKQALKDFNIDYELYCMLRDREQYVLDEQNIYLCSICKDKYHNKFECQKLHYRPLKQMVIFRHLHKINKQKAKRIRFRRVPVQFSSLLYFQQMAASHEQYRRNNFTEEENKQIKLIKRHESKKLQNMKKIQKLKKSSMRQAIQTLIKKKIQPQKGNQNSTLQGNSDTLTLQKLEEVINQKFFSKNFWNLEVDEAANYRYYFQACNPQKLDSKKKKSKGPGNKKK